MRRLALLITTEQMDVDKGNFELFWNEQKEPQPGPGKKEETKFFAQRITIIIIKFLRYQEERVGIGPRVRSEQSFLYEVAGEILS